MLPRTAHIRRATVYKTVDALYITPANGRGYGLCSRTKPLEGVYATVTSIPVAGRSEYDSEIKT